MIVLGINAFHADAAAALMVDGVLVAAAEEERFRRIKHWAGFPNQAISYCLHEYGIKLSDVEHVAINSDPRARLGRKISYSLLQRPRPGLVLDRLRNAHRRQTIGDEFAAAFPGEVLSAPIHRVEHHLAHLASAYLVSPFDAANVVSIDGFGDFSSAAWGVGKGSEIEVQGQVYYPHSLGVFYQALTQFLGFRHYGDEYKVMGLAPYGEPTFLEHMGKIVKLDEGGAYRLDLQYFRHHREAVPYRWSNATPEVGELFSPALPGLLGPARLPGEEITKRHHDIARSTQAMFEAALFHLLNEIQSQSGLTKVALAGGCAMNSVANGRIRANTPFREVYVQAAAGDAGGALGAALALGQKLDPMSKRFTMEHAYWGPQFTRGEIEAAVRSRRSDIDAAEFAVTRDIETEELCRRVAAMIADGKIVGWFRGRMEWGPRALGNRSIIGDPRRADMKELLNAKIKRRESFRPFAPSVLRHEVPAWFETDDDVPFMMKVYPVRSDRREQIPAVTHVDGSGRLQTVSQSTNPVYFRLIECFAELTGVPMVLNTSFNENEPVVCRPEEALDCFLRTGMDTLVLGDIIIERT